jgi:hypothetical protein
MLEGMYDDLDFFTDEEKLRLFGCYRALEDRYEISEVDDRKKDRISETLRGFSMLGGTTALVLGDAWGLRDGGYRCTLCLLVSVTRFKGVTYQGQHYDFDRRVVHHVTLADLGVDFGHVFMRPEGIMDKIAELFGRREVDFSEHQVFSDLYYVVAEDEEKLRAAATKEFLNEIASYHALLVEIVGTRFSAARVRGINRDDALDITGVTFDVLKALKGSR